MYVCMYVYLIVAKSAKQHTNYAGKIEKVIRALILSETLALYKSFTYLLIRYTRWGWSGRRSPGSQSAGDT